MNKKLLHRLFAFGVFLASAIQFFSTAQPSVSFWDPGELSAAAYALEVPHPPGGPLFSLVGHFFYMLPLPGSPGFRMNTVSVLSSAFSVLMLYLVAVRLIRLYKKHDPETTLEALGTYGSAAIGALALSFCDTFWFNGVEANYFAASTLLFSLVTWLMLVWYEAADQPGSWKYVLMIAYLVGLSAGVHLMSVLTIFTVVLLIMFRRTIEDEEHCKKTWYIFLGHVAILLTLSMMMWANETSAQPPSQEDIDSYETKFKIILALVSAVYMGIFWKRIFNRNSYYLSLGVAGIGLTLVYPGIIKKLPSFIRLVAGDNSMMGVIVLLAVLGVLSYISIVARRSGRIALAVAALGAVMAICGVTTYTTTIIRANQHPAMNENDPNSFNRLVTYLNREQYGDFPTFKRRWSGEPQHQTTWTNYSSDLDFFWRYQMNHMFTRYVAWNYIGRESFDQDTGVDWKQLYGIPFFFGLLGLYFHFRNDWKIASVFLILFILMGYLTAFYQNQQEWQPRERDYFYAGAYFVFALWIALGIRGVLDQIAARLKSPGQVTAGFAGFLALAAIFIPVREFQTNYFTHDRSRNWLPWDYSYNLLQTCKPDAILFTNGDNDTFPLWYLQDVEGIRRDVRIVNLSLVNTEWYIRQLKHETPYNSKKINITLSDDYITRIQPMQWKAQTMTLSVPQSAVTGEAHNFNGILDSSVIAKGSITFTMQPTLQYGDISAIRVQDMMVREIVMNNAWQRPIYFANTCSEDTKIGLSDYIRIEGYAGRLVPFRKPADPNIHYYIDEESMRRNLLQDPPAISKTYQPGFIFRGLADKSIFFDQNEARMAENSRGAFMMLATDYLYAANNRNLCLATLKRADQVIAPSVVKMDFNQQYQMALFYNEAGDHQRYLDMSKEIEQQLTARVNNHPADNNEAVRDYEILKDIYEQTGQYAKVLEVLEALRVSYPDDPGLKREIDRFKILNSQQKAQSPK
ncbi:MAG TPA: DUF2723 domain-containing protein [Bacteroidota bacterium]|nr:DUF2723 domain-containing protein [Bacteroidota bacterium]